MTSQPTSHHAALHHAAREAHHHGLCVIPAAANGTKQPWPDGPTWKHFQNQPPTAEQLARWFANGRYDGLGVVCGQVSGGLEMLEFEGRAVAEGFVEAMTILADASGLGDLWRAVTSGYQETTPSGGIHLLYRVAGRPVPKNTKLARRPRTPDELAAWKREQQLQVDAEPDDAQRARRQAKLNQIVSGEQVPQVLIETRGEGGFVVIAPSAGRTHPSGKAWTLTTGGPATIPTLTADDHQALHHLAAALDLMPASTPEPTPPPAQPRQAGGPTADGLRPGDDFNQRATWEDILQPEGWTQVARHGGVTYWRRPGKNRGISATTGRNDGDNLFVFSTSTVFEAETPYSKFAAYTLLNHGSLHDDAFRAAGKALRAAGYGSQPTSQQRDRVPPLPEWGPPPDAPPADDEDDGWQQGPVRRRGHLPEDFWAARPVLRHIRQAAHCRARSGDVVLGGLLARLSSMLPPELRADTGVGSPASMNTFVILLGPSGSGKSSAAWIPRRLLPPPPRIDFLDELPLGTGEGIAEAYMGEEEVDSEEVYLAGPRRGTPKRKVVRTQVRGNALFYADEGESLTKQLFGRTGATIGESIRRAWTGGTIGQHNGQKVNTRVIEAGTYSLGLVVGFQPETALPLIEDAAAGTPQRFLWVASTDPTIPEDIVDDPGPLDLALIRRGFGIKPQLTFDHALLKQIRLDDRARATGELRLPLLDSHKPLTLVKLSVLLAILDNRIHITTEDWQLAEALWATSCELRDALIEYGTRQAEQEAEKRTKAHVDREVRAHNAKAAGDRAIERIARRVGRRVHETQGMTRGEAKKDTASRDRGLLGAALDYAEARGWVVVEGDHLRPGDSRPS
ncbi:bifunctional DNA primase/polymerase [Nonomuraea bangladeshensis]|uniref:Bifunctional DNA primase/polymerase n=1 Tax=Nonomuraea bangladeshensis TaxID=404385 RepID=A0ABV3H4E1_9ACTN